MKTGLLSLCCALMLFASCGKRIPKSDAVAIVPKPVSEQLSDSTFDLTKRTRIRLLADDSTLLRSTDCFSSAAYTVKNTTPMINMSYHRGCLPLNFDF